MADQKDVKFRELIIPHLAGAFNLAKWLTQSDNDASDVLQEASIKAFRFIETTELENPKAWFFQIVRNTAYSLLKVRNKYVEIDFEKEIDEVTQNAEKILLNNASAQSLHESLNELELPFREILILRELEEMSYEDIAETLQIPTGTVMSRLARARALLKKKLVLKGAHR